MATMIHFFDSPSQFYFENEMNKSNEAKEKTVYFDYST
jgi:hypothetical protein